MNISYIITGLNRGGAETQVFLLANELGRLGHSVEIVTLINENGFQSELERAGIPVFSLGMRRGTPDVSAIIRLRRHLRRSRPNIVHAHMIHANVFARISRLFIKIPSLLCTAHLDAEVSERAHTTKGLWKRDLLYRASDWLCDLTTHVSIPGYNRYIKNRLSSEAKTLWVPNGVDTTTFSPSPRRAQLRAEFELHSFTWLAIGRMVPQKDYPNLLNAISLIREKPFTLLIAGDGAECSAIQTLAQQLGLASKIRFLGIRTDVPNLMAASDALVLSSMFESLPMVLLEAHASGLPVVSTNVGGVSDFVRDGETGFLVPAKAPRELAEAMNRLMSLPDSVAAKMGDRGRTLVVKYFSIRQIAAKWQEIYTKLARREPVKPRHRGEPATV